MSSCLILYQNDKLYMSSDTSACCKIGNEFYRISNDAEKIKVIGDMIVFTSGGLELCDLSFKYLEIYKNASNAPELLSKYLNEHIDNVDQYDLEVMIGTIFENKVKVYQISSYEDFDLQVYEGSKDGVGVLASGSNNDELNEYVLNNFNADIKSLYRKAYQNINDEIVGGDMLLYYMDIYSTKKPKLIDEFQIDNYINDRYKERTNIHYVLAKNLVGELLLGNALKIYSEDNSSEMSFDNHGLVLNAKDNGSGLYRRILDIQRDGKSQLWIDEQGNIVLASDQFIQMGNKLDRVVADYADIEKLYVKSADIEKLLAGYIKADQIEVIKGEFKELFAEKAEIKDLQAEHVTINGKLSAQDAEIENLKATKIEAGDLEAYKATIEKLLATYATIKELEANYIKAKDIEATYAKITELDATNANVEKLNAATAEINKLIANKADIKDLKAVNAQIDTLQANYANINELVAKKVDAEYVKAEIVKANKTITDQLDAINATIENLDAKYATIEQLKAARAELDELIAKKASIDDLNAANATIGTLNAQLANINTIMSGSIGTGTLQTLHLTAANVNIDQAVIQDLIAANIAVSDLKAGEISTDKFTIKSADGTMQIVGSTQQFLDENGKVRLQIGKDKQGHFNFIIYGQDGEGKIFDQDGIKAAGIPSNTIVDSMVADNANISGKKLDINSVVDKINEDGTTSINSNKIWIDEENQSLGASFTQIKTSVDNTVKSYTPYYCKSTSNTTPPADGWDEIPPSKLDGEYIWRKEKVVKTDNTVSWTTPYVATGDSGTSPIQIIVTSTNGTSFKQNSTQTTTTLQCVVYRGENKITPSSYNWYQYNGTTWVSLNKTTSSISITLSDVKDVNRYKCVVDV